VGEGDRATGSPPPSPHRRAARRRHAADGLRGAEGQREAEGHRGAEGIKKHIWEAGGNLTQWELKAGRDHCGRGLALRFGPEDIPEGRRATQRGRKQPEAKITLIPQDSGDGG